MLTRARPLLIATLAIALALTALLALAPSPVAASHASPALATLAIQTSAPPTNFVGMNESYVIVASVPVANWTVLAGHNVNVIYTAGSQQATVHLFNASAGTDSMHIEAQASGYKPAYQNWTLTTFARPFIYSLPAFAVVVGSFYNYSVEAAGTSPTYAFVGAPYLALHAYSTGEFLSGTVTTGTYTDVLTVTTASGTFSQAWVTSDSSAPPASVTLSCQTDGNVPMTATVSLANGYPAGCGSVGVFSGDYLLANASVVVAPRAITFVDAAVSPALGWQAYLSGATTSGNTSTLTVYAYSAPGSSLQELVNGANLGSLSLPSAGFTTFAYVPVALNQPGPGPGGGPPPPTNGNNSTNGTGGGGTGGFKWPSFSFNVWTVVAAAVAFVGVVVMFSGPRRFFPGLGIVAIGVVVALLSGIL